MAFLSFAQNGEDVVLWRALHDVVDGQYIDAGAADPTDDSVTRAFYDRGWRGINIEPDPELHERLVAARPEDINLQMGLAAEPGEDTFFLVGSRSGLSTFDAGIADTHSEASFTSKRITVPLQTLAHVCEEHVSGPIHFLKIDVEGSEQAVLQGADFTRWRPWIMVVEATFPNSDRPTHADWEPLLSKAGYRFTLFDGLNRFYLAAEHWDRLHNRLSYSACVRDGYVTRHEDAAKRRVVDLEQLLREREVDMTCHIDQLRADIAARKRDLDEKDAELERLGGEITRRDLIIAQRDGTIGRLDEDVSDLKRRLTDAEHCVVPSELEVSIRDRTTELLASEQRVATLEAELAALRAATERHLAALHASASWRVTAPLRGAKAVWQRLVRPSRTA